MGETYFSCLLVFFSPDLLSLVLVDALASRDNSSLQMHRALVGSRSCYLGDIDCTATSKECLWGQHPRAVVHNDQVAAFQIRRQCRVLPPGCFRNGPVRANGDLMTTRQEL